MRKKSAPRAAAQEPLAGHRQRLDGWTPQRVAQFLETLAETGCVRDAARVAGLSKASAYRLRAKSPAFAARWAQAMEAAQEGLVAIAYKRAVEGKETIIIRKGEEVERRISPSDAMLSLLVKRGDLSGERATSAAISFEEHEQGWHFEKDGRKVKGPSLAEQAENKRLADQVTAKIMRMHAIYSAKLLAEGGPCQHCGGPMTQQLRDTWQAKIDEAHAEAEAYFNGTHDGDAEDEPE
jgi:hypothetical protein